MLKLAPAFSVCVVAALMLSGCAGPNAEHYNTRGIESFRLREYRTALAAFQQAVELEPTSAQYQYNLAAACQAIGELETAIYHYNMAVTIHPGMLKAHENMARCYVAMGKTDEAERTYERACAGNPLSAVPFYQFAMYYLSSG